MNQTFKIGVPEIPGFSGVANDGTNNNGHCQFGGILGPLMQVIVNIMLKHGMRCTLSSNFYNDQNSTHSDAIVAIQNGEYDWLTETFSYETLPVDGIMSSPIVNEDTMTIMSCYNLSTDPHEGTIMSMFTSVPYLLWTGYLLSFFAFVSITYVASYVMKCSKYCSFWNTICAFLDQDNYQTDTLFMSTLSAVVSVAVFFLLSYATNSMGTQLVTIDDPIVIRSYDDVINRAIGNVMMPVQSEWEAFANAKNGSKEWKIFQLTESQYKESDDSRREKFLNQKLVTISRPAQVLITGYLLIVRPDFNKSKGRVLLSVDGEAKKYSKVMAYSSRWKGTIIEDIFNKFYRKNAEHGLMIKFIDILPLMLIDILFEEYNVPSNRRLLSNVVETVDGSVKSIGWIHFKPVLINLIVGFVFPIAALVYEVVRKRIDSKLRRKRRPKHAKRIITIN